MSYSLSRRLIFAWLIGLLAIAGCQPQIVTRTNSIDGKVMVRVPAGEFRMGTSAEQPATLVKIGNAPASAFQAEMPQQTLSLPEFYIDQVPVTNADYKKFLDANPNRSVPYLDNPLARSFNWDKTARLYPTGRDQYPVVLVSWFDAAAYCQWAGGRLPTEAEWEKAARGGDGRLWPWGNEFDATKLNSAEQRKGDAVPVGQFPTGASPYSALDMAGNVWQWTSSLDRPYPYDGTDGREDPGVMGIRVTRGGAWLFGALGTRTAVRNRFDPSGVSLSLGFRCVQ